MQGGEGGCEARGGAAGAEAAREIAVSGPGPEPVDEKAGDEESRDAGKLLDELGVGEKKE